MLWVGCVCGSAALKYPIDVQGGCKAAFIRSSSPSTGGGGVSASGQRPALLQGMCNSAARMRRCRSRPPGRDPALQRRAPAVRATCSQSPGEARAFAPATCDRVAPPAAGDLEPTAGEARRSHTLRVGRYAQHFVDALQMDENPVEYLLRKYPQARAGARPAAC